MTDHFKVQGIAAEADFSRLFPFSPAMAVAAKAELLCAIAAVLSLGPVQAFKTGSQSQGRPTNLVRRQHFQTDSNNIDGINDDGSEMVQGFLGADAVTSAVIHDGALQKDTDATYVLGAAGQNDCPSGYQNILTESACHLAALYQGWPDLTWKDQSHVMNNRAKGCFMWEALETHRAFFNPNTGIPTSPSAHSKPICEKATYVIGAAGQNDCPSGYQNILTVSECHLAAQSQGWPDMTSVDQSHVMDSRAKGCFWWEGNAITHRAFFNPHAGVPPSPSVLSKPICEKADGYTLKYTDGNCNGTSLATSGTATDLSACKASCNAVDHLACTFLSWCQAGTAGCTGGNENKCNMYSTCDSKTDLPGYMTYGKTVDALEVEFSWSDATWHCMTTKHCEHKLIAHGPYDEDWKCKCVGIYFGMDADGTNCSEWVACMNSHKGEAYNEMQKLMNLEVSSSAQLLLLGTGHHQSADLPGCTNPFTAADCGCDADLLAQCTNNGTLLLDMPSLTQCKVSLLCAMDGVCSGWKCALYEDGKRRCGEIFDCTESLLAVSDNGEAAENEAAEGESITRPKTVTNAAGAEKPGTMAPRSAREREWQKRA
jgi:hypothetical protein